MRLIPGILGIGLILGGLIPINDDSGYAYLVILGASATLYRLIYNIARSASYHRPQLKTASLIDPNAWNIAILPGKDGSLDRVQISYTLRY